jgi:hypothetical protein
MWVGRGRALTLAAVLSLVLVLLASVVFSIAGRSRDVASRSVALHALNESLRAATIVRAQVTFAAYLAANDSVYGTDSHVAIEEAVREARQNLTQLGIANPANQAGRGLDEGTGAALTRFRNAADQTLEVTASSQPAGARRLVRARLVPSFALLRDRLVARRDEALDDVSLTGSQLGRLGGLASFVIAFILPTIGVLVYRQITRRSKESIELATTLAKERGQMKRRQQLLAQSLSQLRKELTGVEAGAPEDRLPLVRRLGWNVDAIGTVVAGTHQLAFADVDVAAELKVLAEGLRTAGIYVNVFTAEGCTWTDPAALGAAVRNLALEAQDSGARRIELEAALRGGHVEIRITHDGAALTPALASLVFDRSHDDERTAVEAGAAPIRLLAAQELIEVIGGSLLPLAELGRPAYVIRLQCVGEPIELRSTDAKAIATT